MPSPFRRYWPALLIGVLLLDTTYSFYQYYHQALDGDLAWNVVPHRDVWQILHDPFGWGPLTEGRVYPNPNRFFAHWVFRGYMLKVPGTLQLVCSPIPSTYLAGALAKTGIQLSLVALMTRTILGHQWRQPLAWLVLACLLVPFFQSGQFRSHIGIVDSTTTYAFFYALPAVYLLLFTLPFTDCFLHGERRELSGWQVALLALLAPVVCLSGPLNPGAVLVATTVLGVAWLSGIFRLTEIPRGYQGLLVWVNLLALYSLYLGRFNSLTLNSQLPFFELYAKLPMGIWRQFTGKLAWPVLFAGLAINYFLLRRFFPLGTQRKVFRWILLFAALYIALLPMGGFRSYRATILRYDSILPVTLALVSLYAAGSWWLLQKLSGAPRRWYLILVLAIAGIFTNADNLIVDAYYCERASLEVIAAADTEVVALETDCGVALWQTYQDTSYSTLNGRLFHYWGVTEVPKRYYHPDGKEER